MQALYSAVVFTLLARCCPSAASVGSLQLELITATPGPVIDQDQAVREGIFGGFECGRVVQVNGTYHAFVHELYKPPPAPGWGWIGIGHWRSFDGRSWVRRNPIRVPHWANDSNQTWLVYTSPMPFFDEASNRWLLYHAIAPDDHVDDSKPGPDQRWDSQHVQLRMAKATVAGLEAIDDPTTKWEDSDGSLVALHGPSSLSVSNPWQGANGTWHVFFQENHLSVTMAASATPSGVYTPMPHVKGGLAGVQNVENPVVTRLRDGRHVLVYDYLLDELKDGFSRSFGFLWSPDGITWDVSRTQVVSLAKSNESFWTNIVRTPLGLIEETDGTLTLFYTGRQQNAIANHGVWTGCQERKQDWSSMSLHGCFMGMGVARLKLQELGAESRSQPGRNDSAFLV